MKKFFQPFHLVTLSPWPLLMSILIFNNMIMVINWFYNNQFSLLMFNFFISILCVYQWWRDVVRESTYQGFHTKKVYMGIKFGMILFILSELMFFLSIFWTYMHMMLSPSIDIGSLWPPMGVIPFNPYSIPLLNTFILLSSGVSITYCHYSILLGNYLNSKKSLLITYMLGIIFLMFQYIEYNEAGFSINDSIYGSIFFFSTGFHGFHVMIGTIFLIINYFRLMNFSKNHHVGFETAAWYWHFVDVVWLFLFMLVYFLSY